MPLIEVYPGANLTEEQRENVLKPCRGAVVLHEGEEYIVCVVSIFDGATTRSMKPCKMYPSEPAIKDVILWKDKDKILEGRGNYTLATYDYFLSSKFDLYGMYF